MTTACHCCADARCGSHRKGPPHCLCDGTCGDDGTTRIAVPATMRYSRQMLVAVLVEHQRNSALDCLCGWSAFGGSFAEHVADRYEAAMGGGS